MPENEETATTSQAAEKSRRSRPHKTEGAKRRTRRTTKKTPARAQKPRTQKSNLLFALDIGTRSVIGIAATKEKDGTLAIQATERQEHATRAMLDGQIHDVPQVAAVIRGVKEKLEGDVGPLKSAAVAAAGRALYTEARGRCGAAQKRGGRRRGPRALHDDGHGGEADRGRHPCRG